MKLALLHLVPVAPDGEVEVKVMDGSARDARGPRAPGRAYLGANDRGHEEKVVELRYEVLTPRNVAIACLG